MAHVLMLCRPMFPPDFQVSTYSSSLLWYHILGVSFFIPVCADLFSRKYAIRSATVLKMSPSCSYRHFIISISFIILNITIVSRSDQKYAFLLESMLSFAVKWLNTAMCVYVLSQNSANISVHVYNALK